MGEWAGLAPAVIVHGLADARQCRRAVTLLSAPGAALYGGVGWWRAVAAAAREAGVPVASDILDCGDAPGRALEALRAGQEQLVLRAPAGVFADVAGRARRLGAVVLGAAPPALDLARPGAARLLAAWLGGGGDSGGGFD